MMNLRRAIILLCICLAGSLAGADTLELKNGSVIKGQYAGGTDTQISFRVGSSIQQYAVADVISGPIRMHVDKLGGEIGVLRRGCGVQYQTYRSGNFCVPIEERGRVAQDIGPGFDRILKRYTGSGTERRSTRAGRGISRIVSKEGGRPG